MLGSPLAAAEAVLTPEERELGVALVEIGAGTTRLVVYHGGAIRHTAVLPVGGGHVTSDLAAALRTPFAEAEQLKQRYGAALAVAGAARPHRSRWRASAAARRTMLSRRALAEVDRAARARRSSRWCASEIERAGVRRALTSGSRAHRRRRGAATA